MTLAGGDVLAAGGTKANFAGAGGEVTDFEQDFIFMGVEELCKKYALSQSEYDVYAASRLEGNKLPDLKDMNHKESLDVGFSVKDSRRNYLSEATEATAVVPKVSKYPAKKYGTGMPILDRVLVKRVEDDPDLETLEDGSVRNKKTGFIVPAKYRQHTNSGVVLAIGTAVVMGGVRMSLSEFVRPGDRAVWGDYNSEMFPMDFKKAKALCDSLQIDHEESDEPFRLVRVQDIRLVEPEVKNE